MASCCSGNLLAVIIGIEQGLTPKQSAGQPQQPIAKRAQGTAMAVTALAQGGRALLAYRVTLTGNPRPMIDGSRQPGIAGQGPDQQTRLAAAPAPRRTP